MPLFSLVTRQSCPDSGSRPQTLRTAPSRRSTSKRDDRVGEWTVDSPRPTTTRMRMILKVTTPKASAQNGLTDDSEILGVDIRTARLRNDLQPGRVDVGCRAGRRNEVMNASVHLNPGLSRQRRGPLVLNQNTHGDRVGGAALHDESLELKLIWRKTGRSIHESYQRHYPTIQSGQGRIE